MATMLEKYQSHKNRLSGVDTLLSAEQLWSFQEILYRIEVLEAFQAFSKAAPVSGDVKPMLIHYQMVDGYIEALAHERRYGSEPDETIKKQRDTSHENLLRVIQDARRRFASFSPKQPDHYKREIGKVIATFLPAWFQYRNTYITILKEDVS